MTKIESVTIGNTTLYCGDCMEVLGELELHADAVITDPPYGITACDWDVVPQLNLFWEMLERQTRQSANYVVFGSGKFGVDLINSRYTWYRYDLIWQKNKPKGFLNASNQPMRSHESIFVFGRSSIKKTYNAQKRTGGRKRIINRERKTKSGIYGDCPTHIENSDGTLHPGSILQFNTDGNGKNINFHPTQKPLALMGWLVQTYTNVGDVVVDPYMGSGTTGVACVNWARHFIGIEKETKYFDAACKRIEKAVSEYKEQFSAVREMVEQNELF
jgi:site-specific DNA-methyltransferase (adenine-specific)